MSTLTAGIFGDTRGSVERETRFREAMDLERVRREVKRQLDAEDRGPVPEPEFLTLRQRLARPRTAMTYRIQALQTSGSRVMLAAQFKAGKTTMRDNLVRSLADGDPFLGFYDVSAVNGAIAIVDLEMAATMMDDWLAAQGIRRDDKVWPIPMRGMAAAFNIVDPEIRETWVRRFRAAGVEYLILDCFRPWLDALGFDEHHDAGRLLVAFDALLRDAGIPDGLVVHHMGHQHERARGDSRLRDWPDCEWRLVRQTDDPASPRFLSAYGRDVDVPESRLAYDSETRCLRMADGSRKDGKVAAALDDVLEALDAHGTLSGRSVKEKLQGSHSKQVVDAALKLGSTTGRLKKKTGGPKGAHMFSVPVSRTVPPVSRGQSTDAVTECPSVPIGTGQSAQSVPLHGGVNHPSIGQDTQGTNDGRF